LKLLIDWLLIEEEEDDHYNYEREDLPSSISHIIQWLIIKYIILHILINIYAIIVIIIPVTDEIPVNLAGSKLLE
jgi:hypothetical protein